MNRRNFLKISGLSCLGAIMFNQPISYGGGGCPGNLIIFLDGKIIPIDKVIPFEGYDIDIAPGYYVRITHETWMNFSTSDFFARRVTLQIHGDGLKWEYSGTIKRKMVDIISYNAYMRKDVLTLNLVAIVNDNNGTNRLTEEETEYIKKH